MTPGKGSNDGAMGATEITRLFTYIYIINNIIFIIYREGKCSGREGNSDIVNGCSYGNPLTQYSLYFPEIAGNRHLPPPLPPNFLFFWRPPKIDPSKALDLRAEANFSLPVGALTNLRPRREGIFITVQQLLSRTLKRSARYLVPAIPADQPLVTEYHILARRPLIKVKSAYPYT